MHSFLRSFFIANILSCIPINIAYICAAKHKIVCWVSHFKIYKSKDGYFWWCMIVPTTGPNLGGREGVSGTLGNPLNIPLIRDHESWCHRHSVDHPSVTRPVYQSSKVRIVQNWSAHSQLASYLKDTSILMPFISAQSTVHGEPPSQTLNCLQMGSCMHNCCP